MNQHVRTDVCDEGVNEYIVDLLGSLAAMASEAGLRHLSADLAQLQQRHGLAIELAGRPGRPFGRTIDA